MVSCVIGGGAAGAGYGKWEWLMAVTSALAGLVGAMCLSSEREVLLSSVSKTTRRGLGVNVNDAVRRLLRPACAAQLDGAASSRSSCALGDA